MRSIPSAETAGKLDSIRESARPPGVEAVVVTHDSIPQTVVLSPRDDQDLPQQTRFAGKLADLPDEDLVFLATLGKRIR
jgi:hypothetical protein